MKNLKNQIVALLLAAASVIAFQPAAAGTSGIVEKLFVQAGAGATPRSQTEKLKESVSVTDFGAVGNDVADDTAAFNKAIAALNGRGRLIVPRPKVAYKITGTIAIGTLSTDTSISIEADPGTLVKSYLTGSSVLFDIKNVPGHFNLNGMRGLRMQAATAGAATALQLNGQCFGTFDDLYIEGFGKGIVLTNAGGAGVFTEFVRFNRIELHQNTINIGMYKADGDISFHGISFGNTTINIGANQFGLDISDAAWYNASFQFRMFENDAAATVLRMATTGTDYRKGVFGEGSLTVEGPPTGVASMTGTGRFWFDGNANFMSGVTDNLAPVNAWEMGFVAKNYFKSQTFGTSGYTVSEPREKMPSYGGATNGPFGSIARLSGANMESLIANSYGAAATAPGNGFYTGYTGYQQGFDAGKLGWFLASDGSQIKSFAPAGTTVGVYAGAGGNPYGDNQAFAIKDGNFYVQGAHIMAGSGNPNGVVVGSVGDMYLNRQAATAGPGQTLFIKESGTNDKTGWVGK